MKSVIVFVMGGLFFGGISLGIGYAIWGDVVLIVGATAFGLTFVPAAITLAWVVYSYRTAPEMQLLASVGSSGVRMAIALGGGYLLTQSLPQTFDMSFWFWVLVFYLTFLATEISLIVARQPKSEQPVQS